MRKEPIPFHGIVLYRRLYRDNDMLVKFFTAEGGKKMFWIRGAAKPQYKLRASILPFSYGIYKGHLKNNGLSYLNTTNSIFHFWQISKDIVLNAYASYIIDLIDKALADNEPNLKWFNNLYYGLHLIDLKINPEIITIIFELQLLSEFGVKPNLTQCVECGKKTGNFDYSESYGGLICSQHYNLDQYRLHLNQKTIYWLQKLSLVNLAKVNKININNETQKELRKTLNIIYKNSVGLNLKSKSFLEEINSNKFFKVAKDK